MCACVHVCVLASGVYLTSASASASTPAFSLPHLSAATSSTPTHTPHTPHIHTIPAPFCMSPAASARAEGGDREGLLQGAGEEVDGRKGVDGSKGVKGVGAGFKGVGAGFASPSSLYSSSSLHSPVTPGMALKNMSW